MKMVQGKIFLLPVVAAALVACGGSSDSDNPLPPETITLTGTVAKGTVSGAKMRVLSAAASPVVLASGFTTDANGRYTIKLNKTSGPVVIEADLEGADIADETNPGVPYKGKPGEKMRAIISPTASAADATANVTPFSEMAVDLVAEAGWEAKAVNDANRIVRQLLNNTDHLTASPTAGALLASLTAVQQLVNSTEGGLTAVLTRLRDAAGGVDGSVSIAPGLVAALDAACGTTTACAEAFATPEPIVIGTGDLVDPVYSLFQDLRDTLLAYSNEAKTGELDVAAVKLDEAVKAAVQPIDDEMLGVLAMFSKGDDAYRAFRSGTSTQQFINSGSSYGRTATFRTDGTPVVAGWLPRYGCEVASATIETKADGSQDVKDYTTSGVTAGNANVFACFGVGTVGRLYPARDGTTAYWHSVVFIPQTDGSFKYVHQLRSRPFDQRSGAATRVKAVYGNLGVTRDGASELTGFNLNGKLVPGLQGHAPGEYETLDRVDATLSFVGSEPTSTSAKYDLGGLMTLYKTGNVFASSVEIASGSMVEVKTDVPFSYTNYVYVYGASCPVGYAAVSGTVTPHLTCVGTVTGFEEGFSALNLDVTVTAPGVKFQGIVSADTPSFDSTNTVYIPTKMRLQGKIFEADGAGHRLLLDGAGSVELLNYASFNATANTASPVKVVFDGKVLLKNRPEMRLTLSGERTALREQSLSGTFFWNSKALKFAAATNGDWTVSNDSGVRFTIPKGQSDTAQDVFLGNVKVGTVNFGRSRIDYADGRFQQF